jgi:DNA sulfur modification protein DndC
LTDDVILRSIEIAKHAILEKPHAQWVLAFSGGKDSTAALKIMLSAYKRAQLTDLKFTVIYCDTGVENPILDSYVKKVLRDLDTELRDLAPSFKTKLLKAPIQDRFFVRIIGRGYPPPTNSFRWCTNGLRIRPVAAFLEQQDPTDTIVVLGLRKAESQQRDRTFAASADVHWQKQREGNRSYDLFLPVAELDVAEVWDAVFWLRAPTTIDPHSLEELYRDASGECPVLRAPTAPPCASGRFGCWTCTVVRQDKSARELIKSGYSQLRPFLDFRDWLAQFRNDPSKRWPKRRNGSQGLGPFTMAARMEILRRVNDLEALSGSVILDSDERGAIAGLWKLDDRPRLSFK